MDNPTQPAESPELNLPEEEIEPTPLLFKVVVFFAAAYLLLRLIQGVQYAIDWLGG